MTGFTGTRRRAVFTAAGIVVLVVVALFINRATAKSDKPSAQRTALIAAAKLPDCPAGSGSAVAGGLPSMTFPCLANGPKVNLAALRGPLIVNIWAGPCTECRAESPQLHAFAAAAAGKVAMLGVVDGAYNGLETWDDALDASHGLGLTYPSLWDANGKFVQWTRAAGIPVTIFVKPDGSIAHRKVGVLGAGELNVLTKQYLGVDVPTT